MWDGSTLKSPPAKTGRPVSCCSMPRCASSALLASLMFTTGCRYTETSSTGAKPDFPSLTAARRSGSAH
eukprot:1123129-Pyramimonas_sp.AAC.1